MIFVETEVKIERAIKTHDTEKLVTRFCLFGMYFHANLCKKENCSTCKFLNDYIWFLLWGSSSREEKICIFQDHCRNNHREFYCLFLLFFSLTKSEVEKVNLNGTLKGLLIDQCRKPPMKDDGGRVLKKN